MSFLKRQFLIWILALAAFIFLGSLTSIVFLRATAPAESTPPIFFARLVQKVDAEDPIAGVKVVEDLSKGGRPLVLELLSAKGEVLYPPGAQPPANFFRLNLPKNAFDAVNLDESHDIIPQRPRKWLFRLGGEPVHYLYINFLAGQVSPAARLITVAVFALVFSLFLGAGFTLLLLFQNLRKMQITERSRMSLLQELAHDLRTPVASLKNLLETMHLQKSTLPAHLREELMILSLKEVEYFQRLVEDLLILAQVSDPRYQLNRSHFDFAEMVADEAESKAFHDIHRNEAGEKIRLELHAKDERVEVSGDSHLLRRMLRNGLDNAFSFASSTVTVTLEKTASKFVTLYIEDDGPGLTEDALISFGQRRLTRALGHQEDGRLSVGLGSVIMKTLAGLHEGSIHAANRSTVATGHRGARIVIQLPLSDNRPV